VSFNVGGYVREFWGHVSCTLLVRYLYHSAIISYIFVTPRWRLSLVTIGRTRSCDLNKSEFGTKKYSPLLYQSPTMRMIIL